MQLKICKARIFLFRVECMDINLMLQLNARNPEKERKDTSIAK